LEDFLRLDDLKGPPIYELEENIHMEIAVIPVDMLKNVFTIFEHCTWTPGFATGSTLCDIDCPFTRCLVWCIIRICP